MINYSLKIKHFNELSCLELYKIMILRQEVFVLEQNCPFVDADGKDLDAFHLMMLNENDELLAYTRLLDAGIAYAEYPSIGRVVSSSKARGIGIGKALMQHSIEACEAQFGQRGIKIGAQLYLKKFYENFGFEQVSEPYDEDGILHISMVRKG